MKKTLLAIVYVLTVQQLLAQKFEFSVHLNSGLFYYNGATATHVSFINERYNAEQSYTNNPYGTKPTLSYGVAGQIQYVSKINLLVGLQVGYQNMRSSVDLYMHKTPLLGASPSATYLPAIGGHTIFSNQSINYNPYIGYRIKIKRAAIDLDAGLNIDENLRSHENGRTQSDNGPDITTNSDHNPKPSMDFGYRFELKANYLRYGVTAGYNYGTYNYFSGYAGGRPEAYSRMIRFGLSYRIH
jgi:hypothetical protein